MRARWVAFVVSLGGVVGCQGVLGDFTIGATEDAGSDATAGASSSGGSGGSGSGGSSGSSASGSSGSSSGSSGSSGGSSGSSGGSSASGSSGSSSSGGSGSSSGSSSSSGSGSSSGSSSSSGGGSSSGSSSSSGGGSGSGDGGATCDSTTCPNGCCDGNTCVQAGGYTQCGYGGVACSACPDSTYQCVGGHCACPIETEICGGSCVDPLTNNTYCGTSLTGSCSSLTACDGGTTCQNGACACPSGDVSCNGTCIDEQTDPNNCGACGHSCGSGATCSAGTCKRVAVCTFATPGSGSAQDLTVNANTAGFTWSAGASGSIVACNLSQTGQTAPALATLSVAPTGITSDSSSFYWTSEHAGVVTSGSISGGATSNILTGLSNPVGIARAPANVGAGGTPSVFYGSGSAVYAYNGGTTSTCISGMVFPYDIGSSVLAGGGVAPAGAWIAAPDLNGNAVYAVSSSACTSGSGGAATVPIATGVIAPDTAATDGTSVYFGTRGNSSTPGALYMCPVGGCNPVASPTPYVASQGSVGRVVLDGSNVIWTANDGLVECAKTGCTKPTVLDSTVSTTALQAQGGTVYYVSGATLYRIAE